MITSFVTFWIVAGALAIAVAVLLSLAMIRRREAVDETPLDVSVYRDQLAEIDRDLARGVLSEADAAQVRLEVSRRLLEADKAARSDEKAEPSDAGAKVMGWVLVPVVVIAAVALYAATGRPSLPDQPLKTRLSEADAMRESRPSQAAFELRDPRPFVAPENADPAFLDLMSKLRAAVMEKPDDQQGQMLLARNEAMLGNFRAAHPAMAALIRLKGDAVQSRDWATYADLLVLAVNGYVSPEAEEAANKALALEPRNGTARYYLGLMYAQNARPDRALAIWDQLLRESSAEAPWVPPILAQIEAAAEAAGVRYSAPQFTQPDLPGPSREDIEAAGEMEAADRQAMIRGMVEGLAERLASEGGSAQEWARLINALGVLGDQEHAAEIWAEAQQVFGDDAAGLAAIQEAARAAGVSE